MTPKTKKTKKQGYAIISKYNGEIMEAYDDFEMHQAFSSLKGARMYIKKIYTKKQWPNYNRDIKVIPCEITYQLPTKSAKK